MKEEIDLENLPYAEKKTILGLAYLNMMDTYMKSWNELNEAYDKCNVSINHIEINKIQGQIKNLMNNIVKELGMKLPQAEGKSNE